MSSETEAARAAPRRPVVAIDGPAGAGKSVVGQRLAEQLGYLYLDTGALYRALTWLALDRGVDPSDERALVRLLREADVRVERAEPGDGIGRADGRLYTVLVDDRDVTSELTGAPIASKVSVVAAHAAVRAELLPIQRRLAAGGGVVIVGRDIGTIVCPDADVKVYLDASPATRVERRIQQLAERGVAADPASVAAEIALRDRLDQQRSVAPLRPAPDALILKTDHLTIGEEIATIQRLVEERASPPNPLSIGRDGEGEAQVGAR